MISEQEFEYELAMIADLKSDTIAEFLTALQIKGTRHNPCACPISKFLSLVDKDALVNADYGQIIITYDTVDGPVEFKMKTPEPVREFMAKFDGGRYPTLDVRHGKAV